MAPRAQDRDADPDLLEAVTSTGAAAPEKSRRNEELESICASTSQARAAALAASFKKVVESVQLKEEGVEEEGEDLYNIQRIAALPSSYVDSGSANSNMLHRPTGVELQTRALSSLTQALNIIGMESTKRAQMISHEEENDDDEVVEEWEALRDVVCQRRTGHSTSRLYAGLSSNPPSGLTTPGWGNSRPPSPPVVVHEDIDGGRALQRIWKRWKYQIDSGELDRSCV